MAINEGKCSTKPSPCNYETLGFLIGWDDGLYHASIVELKIFFWNCRGLENSKALYFLSILVNQHLPNCVFLAETKNNRNFMDNVC